VAFRSNTARNLRPVPFVCLCCFLRSLLPLPPCHKC